MLGVLLIHKHPGCTSHDVVASLRRKFSTRRVGHAGTLDPLATGLLVVAVGPATRFLQYLPMEPKEYVAEIAFGRATETYDLEGETVSESPVPTNLPEAIAGAVVQFRGLIQQLPPMYSAVKIGGKPLYAYARAGDAIDREARTVHVGEFEILSIEGPVAKARIVCSGGTYIRTLAHDLGRAIGCGAHLASLVRTRVGKFHLEDATPLDEIVPTDLIGLREALDPMPVFELDDRPMHDVREGRQIEYPAGGDGGLVALADSHGRVFSVGRIQNGRVQPECVIPSETFEPVTG